MMGKIVVMIKIIVLIIIKSLNFGLHMKNNDHELSSLQSSPSLSVYYI